METKKKITRSKLAKWNVNLQENHELSTSKVKLSLERKSIEATLLAKYEKEGTKDSPISVRAKFTNLQVVKTTEKRQTDDNTMLHLPQYIKCAKTLKVGQSFNSYTESKGPDLGLGSTKSDQKSGYVLDYRLIRTPEDFKDFFKLHTVLFLKVSGGGSRLFLVSVGGRDRPVYHFRKPPVISPPPRQCYGKTPWSLGEYNLLQDKLQDFHGIFLKSC